jgi:hypothetical protein
MRVTEVSLCKNLLSLSKYWLIVLSLVALGCASAPNLLYVGADPTLEYPIVRTLASKQDYPILISTTKGQAVTHIRWTERGSWVWGAIPFGKASKVQFKLFQPDMTAILCDSTPIDNSLEKFDCKFPVNNYIGRPLVGELNYWFIEKPGDDDLPGVVLRTYYLIEQPE